MSLAEDDPVLLAIPLGSTEDNEQGISIALQLGTLVGGVGVFDRQVVQPELALDVPEKVFVRLVQADPDEPVGIRKNPANVLDFDVGDAPALAVCCGVDDGTDRRRTHPGPPRP